MLIFVIILAVTGKVYGIVGGESADIQNFNYHVGMVVMNHVAWCSGALVKPNIVITTGYCGYHLQSIIDQVEVRAGSNTIDKGGEVLRLKAIKVHPLLNLDTYDYDISILYLNGSFKLSEKIGTLDLVPKDHKFSTGAQSVVTAFGGRKYGEITGPLQALRMPHIDWNYCKRIYYIHFTQRMSCWGYIQGGKGVCRGDTGGPVVTYDKSGNALLTALVSWGFGCASEGFPGTYTDLTNTEIHDFLSKNLSNN